MKNKILIISIIVLVIVGIFLIQHFFLSDFEKSGTLSPEKKNEPSVEDILDREFGKVKVFEGEDIIDPKGKYALLETSYGNIKLEFIPDHAPNTVQSFIHLANDNFYDGLTIHRVVNGQFFQTGCPKGNGTGSPGYRLKAEFNKELHLRGSVSMARAGHYDTAGSQFFVCTSALPSLDSQYTVFARVIDGMDVVDKIVAVSTDNMQKPFEKILLKSVGIVSGD